LVDLSCPFFAALRHNQLTLFLDTPIWYCVPQVRAVLLR
jgi:hypothetical protein